MSTKPQVGVAVIITRDDQILLIKRKGPHGHGTWATPGGHLEYGESPEECAVRETKEEVGMEVTEARFRAITNDVFADEGKHYITIWMDCRTTEKQPCIAAEEEVSELGWFAWEALPHPLFLSLANLIEQKSYPPK